MVKATETVSAIVGKSYLERFISVELFSRIVSGSIVLLRGPIGAGKTTMVKLLLKLLGVDEVVSSPTFSYVNHYTSAAGCSINHFDLYRIKDPEEFLAQGFDELLADKQAISLIEWPEILEEILKNASFQGRCINIVLSYDPNDLAVRCIQISSIF